MPNMTMVDLQSKLSMSLDDIISKDRKKKPEKKEKKQAAGAKAKAQPQKKGAKAKVQKTPVKKNKAKQAAVTKSGSKQKGLTAAQKQQSKKDKLAAKKNAEAAALAAKKVAKSKGKGKSSAGKSKGKGKDGKSKGKGKGSWDSWNDRDDDWYSDSWSKGGKGKGKGKGKGNGGKGKGKGKGKGWDDWSSGYGNYSEWGSSYDGRWDPAPGRPSTTRQRDSFASSGIRPKLTASSQSQGFKVSISNLPKGLSKSDLQEAFAACGAVNQVTIKPQFGQGFVWFKKERDADAACKTYNGGDLNGYKIKVFKTGN